MVQLACISNTDCEASANNGLHCCLATSCTIETTRITGAATVYMGFVPVAASFNFPRSMIQIPVMCETESTTSCCYMKLIATYYYRNSGKVENNVSVEICETEC